MDDSRLLAERVSLVVDLAGDAVDVTSGLPWELTHVLHGGLHDVRLLQHCHHLQHIFVRLTLRWHRGTSRPNDPSHHQFLAVIGANLARNKMVITNSDDKTILEKSNAPTLSKCYDDE